jgi:hypothetical protein
MDLRRAALSLALLASEAALRAADCNRNGSEDAADIAEGRSGDCNRNGVPDECDTAPVSLVLPLTVSLDESPTAILAADLDGDGDIDLAAAVAGGIMILSGDGRGGFRPLRTEPLLDDPVALLAADLDGDGSTDLLLADALQNVRGRGTLSMLENEGTGRFRPAKTIAVPPGPAAFAPADVDQDGDIDLALACKDAGGVAILRGDGRGSFEEAPFLATEGSPAFIAVSDLDGDRRVDVLAGDPAGTLFLFLQRAPGEMEASAIRLDAAFEGLSLADFDGDGDADIALGGPASDGSGRLVVLANDGKGVFAASAPRFVSMSPRLLSAADLDRDGNTDLVSVDELASSITIWPGPQMTERAPGKGYATGPNLRHADIGDVDGDRDLDIIVAEEDGLAVLLNDGTGQLQAPGSIRVGEGAGRTTSLEMLPDGRAVPLDFDRDGRPDLAVLGNDRSAIIFGGAGGFPEAVMTFAARPGSREVAAADLDGDGFPDLAVANWSSGGLFLHRNGGRRNIVGAGVLSPGIQTLSVVPGDFDQDGDMDLAAVSLQNLSIWENRGDAAFSGRRQIDVGSSVQEVVAGDLDGDGDLDLAAAAAANSKISIIENLQGGAYVVVRTLDADGSFLLLSADLDGDGNLDLLAEGPRGLIVFWNRGDATFEKAVHSTAGYEIQSIAPADFDGDGDLDVALAGFEDEPLEIVINRGRRRLVSVPPVIMAGRVLSIGAADLNADGRAEVLVSRPVTGTLLVLRTVTLASQPDRNANGLPDECEGAIFIRGDPDGDGRIGISDAIFLLLHLFGGGREPPCQASADVEDDGSLALGDPVRLLDYLFRGGLEPTAPFPDCDAQSPGEALPCEEYPPCAR